MAENQVYLIKSGSNSFVEETEAVVGISGGKVGIGTTHPEADLHVTGDTQIDGDLTVKGDLTTVNSTTIQVDDKNIELGSTENPTDTTADGGGITVKGATDKTFNWLDATDAWTSSEHLYLANGKHFSADELRALDADGLKLADATTSGVLIKGGKVGIHQTTPVYDLDVDGSGNFSQGLYVNGQSVLTGSSSDLGKWEDGTAGDIYYNGGDVGVGIVDPASKLHVVGDARVDGNFIVNNGTSGNLNVEELNLSGDYVHVNYLQENLSSDRGGLKVSHTGVTNSATLEYLSDTNHWQFNKKLEVLGDVDIQNNLTIGGLISNNASVENNFTVGNNLTVSGNFEVKGTTTTVNTQTVTIEDHNLVIASNTGYNQLTEEYPNAGGGYAGLFWGTGDAGEASPVSLTYQHNKGFNFTGAGVGIGVENPAYDLDVAGTGNFSSAVQAPSILQNGNTVVDQGDIGSEPNQIPLNKDLGSLAYMNAPQIEDLNVDTLELREIAAELSETAVDVFVYDTRRDSDGGAWRSRTSHTSWYNEELNTATRGGRREFPAVAVIVAESNKVTIYDGDDPDLSMWMVFNASGGRMIWATQLSCVSSLNARLSIGSPASGFRYIDFVSDKMREWRTSGVNSISGDISERNSGNLTLIDIPGQDVIVNQIINDVAMTVLPNAPIDDNTGLPIPTIAVATDGGVSVIRDDGSVVDYTCTYSSNNKYSLINFIEGSKLLACSRDGETYPTVFDIPSQDKASFDSTDIVFSANPSDSSSAADIRVGNYSEYKASAVTKENIAMGGTSLIISNIDNISGDQTADNVIISSTYNTGWMPGDIKLAALSDTKIETVGVDESNNLVNNGTFDSDSTGWTENNAILTVNASNQLVIADNGDYSSAYQSINTIVGRKYILTFDNASGSNSLYVRIFNDTFKSQSTGDVYHSAVPYTSSANGLKVEFTAESETTVIAFAGASTTDAIVDNISVKQTGELITNGTFDNDTTGWDSGARGDITISEDNGQAKVLTSGTGLLIHQQISGLQIGKKYTISARVTPFVGYSGQIWQFYLSNENTNAIESINIEDQSPTEVSSTFVATSVDQDISFGASSGVISSGEYFLIDNISVRLAEDDRSVNDNGLQVFGEITKSPVAPGADLVAYSGFSGDDYLMQPYNSDLDFGTGDFCVMGWAKTTSTANQKIFTRDLNLTNRFQVYINNGGVSVFTEEDDQFSYLEGSTDVNNGSWFNFFCIRRSGVLEVYVNGKQETAQASGNHETARNLNFGQIASYTGIHIHNSANYFEGSIALLRISATAPTSDQITKIYRDEKPLFQDGAQATLYGTSDAVTALAYDDSDDLLHVGTASGRSVFNGLKRVDNTTTAVSTAISATEGLVIEQ